MLSITDVELALNRIAPFIHRTPIVSSQQLNQWLGHNVYFKVECLQKVGAFKARGACNTIAWLIENNNKPKKIVSNSSGNHAQAVAWAASRFNIPTTIYMAKTVSKVKAQATRSYGAEVVLCESRAEADQCAINEAKKEGGYWISSFNHPQVVAGQGTAAYEAFEDIAAMGVKSIDALFAPCGGGGILSGSVITANVLSPNTQVIGAEPVNANAGAQSLRAGQVCTLTHQPSTMADGAMPMSVCELTLKYLQKLDALYEIEEQPIAYWTQWLSHLLKLHVEPTSAMSMAAVTQWLKTQSTPQNVLVILTGGNIDCKLMNKIWQDDLLVELPSL